MKKFQDLYINIASHNQTSQSTTKPRKQFLTSQMLWKPAKCYEVQAKTNRSIEAKPSKSVTISRPDKHFIFSFPLSFFPQLTHLF